MINERKIRDILHQCGMPSSLLGYEYIKYAIELLQKEPLLKNSIVKGLYPKIAEKYNTRTVRVERGIRNAIDVAWKRGNQEYLNAIFGSSVSDVPTNTEFIVSINEEYTLKVDFDIYNSKPRQVICCNSDHDSLGGQSGELLETGRIYNVRKVVVHNWHTEVYLDEFPEEIEGFNSVYFQEL